MVERTIPLSVAEQILKRAGAERVGEDARAALKAFIEFRIGVHTKKAVKFASHAGRKTVRAEDIHLATER